MLLLSYPFSFENTRNITSSVIIVSLYKRVTACFLLVTPLYDADKAGSYCQI